MPSFGSGEVEQALASGREACARIIAESSDGARFAAEPVVEVGDPAQVIVRAAGARDADLLVLGGGDKPALGALLFHPVLERVMRTSYRPVWVARPQLLEHKVERVLCAVDPSRPTGKALGVSLFLARAFGAAVDLIAVVPHTESRPEAPGAQRDWLSTYLEKFSLPSERKAVAVEIVTRAGQAGARIVDLATERNSDLVVMGSGGRSGLRRWLQGNTAARAARVLPCSILTVRTVERGESGRLKRIKL